MSVDYKFKSCSEAEKERLNLVRPYAKSDLDLEFLYLYFGVRFHNCQDPAKILNACDTLCDYKFSELFEEVKLSDITDMEWMFPTDDTPMTYSFRCFIKGAYLILGMDDGLYVNTNRMAVRGKELRFFKPNFDAESIQKYLTSTSLKIEDMNGAVIECFADLIWANQRMYYKSSKLADILTTMTIKFVPSIITDGQKQISPEGLLQFRYNEVS